MQGVQTPFEQEGTLLTDSYEAFTGEPGHGLLFLMVPIPPLVALTSRTVTGCSPSDNRGVTWPW